MKTYTTILEQAEVEFEEKKSRFIGAIAPVNSEEEAMAFIAGRRAAYRDASHTTYGYLVREGNIRRYSDDGEPQGTAGIPVSEVLVKAGITDAVITVTRYFGGIKLGGGGLVRAYSHTAALAVAAAKKTTLVPCTIIAMELDYSQYGTINHLLPTFPHKLINSDFGVIVKMNVMLKDDDLEQFKKSLADATNATVFPAEIEKLLADIEV